MHIEARISGIPCLIEVHTARYRKPDYFTWASDIDYYGGWDLDYTICDRRGRYAPWLERKATPTDIAAIEEKLMEANSEY